MPNPKASDPHTIAFLRDGRIFFTVQAGNFIGTLDPKAPDGAIKLIEAPTAELAALRRPPRLEGRAVLRLVQLQQDRQHRSADLGHPGVPAARPEGARRAASPSARTTRCGTATTRAASSGHLDPKTGKVEEFQSPGGAESKPYAIDVTADGAVWYVETGDEQKNVLVRFNPETKKFLTWPIPGGGGTVRNMDIDKDGNLWLAESGVGKIAKVTITVGKATQ